MDQGQICRYGLIQALKAFTRTWVCSHHFLIPFLHGFSSQDFKMAGQSMSRRKESLSLSLCSFSLPPCPTPNLPLSGWLSFLSKS